MAGVTHAWAVLAGLGIGLGLWSLLAAVPRFGRASLAVRIAPYLRDVSREAMELVDRRPSSPLPVLGVVAAPITDAARKLIESSLGGRESVAARLRQAGSTSSVDGYRSRQLAWLAVGCGAGALVGGALAATRGQPLLVLGLAAVGGVLGVVASDWALSRAARRRVARMELELPAVLEFLMLALSAGEGVAEALSRVARVGRGELVSELRDVVVRVGAGVPLPRALSELSAELRMPAFTRVSDQLVGALDRGSPVVDVLRAQAQDARDDRKRMLLESAGRKEVAMLVPLVFLILPTTVVFAVWPGLALLQLGF